METKLTNSVNFEKVQTFYQTVIEQTDDKEYDHGWVKGAYPSEKLLREAIRNHSLYVLVNDQGEYMAAMILTNRPIKGYEDCAWSIQGPNDAITVVQALAVLPRYRKNGYAKRLVWEAIHIARSSGQKAIHVDINTNNVRAQQLYTHLGFDQKDHGVVEYPELGSREVNLYEYVLKPNEN